MTTSTKSLRAQLALFLALAAGLLLLSSGPASAAPPVAKDGRIYACFKAKGKGKGDLRVVRGAKVRCPRKWKKVSWYAQGFSVGAAPPAAIGPAGPQGERGPAGPAGAVLVAQLEGKVSELLTRVESLEAVLGGVTNADLLSAISLTPTVGALCEQTEGLSGQVNALLGSVGGLNSLLDTLLVLFDPVSLPEALPAFDCPTS